MENIPNKHWTNTNGWGMNNVVLVVTKITIQTTNYISVSCDEMINIDNQSWNSIHVYVVEDSKGH